MEGTYTKNGWQQTTQKILNYKPEETKYRKATNEMGRWFPGGRNRPRGLRLIVYDDLFISCVLSFFYCFPIYSPSFIFYLLPYFLFMFIHNCFSFSFSPSYFIFSLLPYFLFMFIYNCFSFSFSHLNSYSLYILISSLCLFIIAFLSLFFPSYFIFSLHP